MICLNCKKQIPDDSQMCPFCGKEIIQEEQLPREISFRRYQRWFFYGIISLVFFGMIGVIIKIYNANSALLLEITDINQEFEKAKGDLSKTEGSLVEKGEELKIVRDDLSSKSKELSELENELTKKTDELKGVALEKVEIKEGYEQCQVNLNLSDANIYGLIVKLGKGITNDNLVKIPLAEANLEGTDTDEDGLSNVIEDSLGTDKNKKDTDGDSFSDKDEILDGYNPLGAGMLNIDINFANNQKGEILLQVEQNGEAWYVAGDGKRYFLGLPADAFKTMRGIEYWTKDWKS